MFFMSWKEWNQLFSSNWNEIKTYLRFDRVFFISGPIIILRCTQTFFRTCCVNLPKEFLFSKSSFCFPGIFLQSELCNRLCQTTWRILWSHLGDKEGNERLCWCRIFQDNKTVYILNVSAKTNQGLDWLNTMSPCFLYYYMVIFELKTK